MDAKLLLVYTFILLVLGHSQALPSHSQYGTVTNRKASDKSKNFRLSSNCDMIDEDGQQLSKTSSSDKNLILLTIAGGGRTAASPPSERNSTPKGPFRWFRPSSTRKERSLAAWLLLWNGIALIDAFMFTFRAKQNLDGYLVGEWGPHTLAQTRMLANCQLALIATSSLVACIADEKALRLMFKILILATLGAFRAVAAGVAEGTVKAPWKTGYAAVMSAPPLLLLAYFAFIF